MSIAPISRYPVPDVRDWPADVRERILAVQEKAGFVPNVFLTLAYRPDEFRAFFRLPRCTHAEGRRPDERRS